jgi:hypothetical protein
MRATRLLTAAVITLALAASLRAGDPFLITAKSTSGTPETVSATGSTLPDLVSHLIKGTDQFSSLQDRDISASVRYGGENNAIIITRNAANTSANLVIPGIGFKKTFTGTNEGNLEKQIENFAKNHGSEIYGKFIRSINETTPLGVTDGNPLASTALLANQAFLQFGLQASPTPPAQGIPNPLDQVATPDIRFDFSSGYSHNSAGSGYFASGAFSLGFKFGDRIGLVFATPFTYRNVQGADVYDIGEEVSLPILVIEPEGDRSFSWLLTPTVFGGAAGSYDLASGGTFLGGGITNSVSFQLDTFLITVANSFDYFHGFPVSFANYKLETNLDQEVLKNGVKVAKYFSDSLYVDGSFTYTNFLEKAAVRNYFSPGAGVGFRFGSYSGLRLGYAGDFGTHGFTVHGAQLQLYFNY